MSSLGFGACKHLSVVALAMAATTGLAPRGSSAGTPAVAFERELESLSR